MSSDETKSGRGMTRREMLLNPLKRLRERNYGGFDAPVASRSKDQAEHFAKANKAYAERDWQTAVGSYRAGLKAQPNNASARRRLGFCLYQQGQYIQSKVELERVLRAVADDNEALLYLGLCLVRLGRIDEGLATWRKYFEPGALEIQRELNTQIAFAESSEDEEDRPDHHEIVAAVEKAIARQEQTSPST